MRYAILVPLLVAGFIAVWWFGLGSGRIDSVLAPEEGMSPIDSAVITARFESSAPAVPVILRRASTGAPVAQVTAHLALPGDVRPLGEVERLAGAFVGLARAGAHRVRANERGELAVPRTGHDVEIFAETSTLVGHGLYVAGQTEPVVIDMVPHDEVRVRVVDRHSEPVSDVPVLLGLEGEVHPRPLMVRRTGPDGIASFRDVGAELARGSLADEVAARRPVVAIGLSVTSREQVAFDPRSPRKLLELRIPATGSMTFRIRGPDGLPYAGKGEAWLVRRSLPDEREWVTRDDGRLFEGGVIHFPRVGVDGQVELHLSGAILRADHASKHLAPRVEDELVEARITWTGDLPRIRGRAVWWDGSPVARRQLAPQVFDYQRLPIVGVDLPWIETNASGGFELGLEHVWEKGKRREGSLTVVGEAPGYARFDLSFETPPAGTDIGEVVLDPVPVMIAGTIGDPQGDSVGPAWVVVEAGSGGSWILQREYTTESDAEGRFTIWGVAPGDRARVRAVDWYGNTSEWAEFSTGSEQPVQLVIPEG